MDFTPKSDRPWYTRPFHDPLGFNWIVIGGSGSGGERGRWLFYGSYSNPKPRGLWVPWPLNKILVRAWNRTACSIWGHDDFMKGLAVAEKSITVSEVTCVNCCAQIMTSDELHAARALSEGS